ncbi:arrestin domain-containing protein 17-like [Babylonia areolata]|uniref:arrestin domain-containing protein 17-like n=1 Tax=Babylonia areolata TaxID=304850 RepID=UPI003FD64077
MGRLKRFDILFENSDAVFFAGHEVSGTVCVELAEAMKMRELRMTCLGRAHVHWSEVENVGHRGGRQRIETVEYSDNEDYFQFELLLWKGRGSYSTDSDNDCMAAGEHWLPFSFTLPPNLPPSFEGDYGYIRYWTKATVDRPWKFDHHTKRAFSVISGLDLNQEPTAPESLHYHGEISAGCCCVPSGRFSGRFCTNYRGFVPGTDLMLFSEIENYTSSVCWAEVRLKLHVTYISGRKYKQEKKVIRRVQMDDIQRGKSTTWREALQIPPLPPSRLRGCKLITTTYLLQFIVSSDARCSCDDIEFEDEIIIGTIPLVPAPPPTPTALTTPPVRGREGEDKQSNKKKGKTARDDVILDVLDGRKPLSSESSVTGPPSYEECMFGQVSIRDKDDSENTAGTLTFAPRYSFYRHSHSARSPKGS